jgi:hypothetical protein
MEGVCVFIYFKMKSRLLYVYHLLFIIGFLIIEHLLDNAINFNFHLLFIIGFSVINSLFKYRNQLPTENC